jgi:hypothetical protein
MTFALHEKVIIHLALLEISQTLKDVFKAGLHIHRQMRDVGRGSVVIPIEAPRSAE